MSLCATDYGRERRKTSKMEEEENGKDRMSSNKEMPTAKDIVVVECVYRSRLVVDDDITRNREYIYTHTRRTMRND
jgi:hypothetical protein